MSAKLASGGTPATLRSLEAEIEDFILHGKHRFETQFKHDDGAAYVVKYMLPARLGSFMTNKLLYASDVPSYTWGDAVYVAPLVGPFSTMIFGRVGIVGTIDPQRVYDATGTAGKDYYQQWIRFQWRWYDLLTTTVHSPLANRYLRNRFRTRFRLDCVLFRPDQFCTGYVDPAGDTWFAITHWDRYRRVAFGTANCVQKAEWCVVTCEEFEGKRYNFVYDAILGPSQRGGARLTRQQLRVGSANLVNRILATYRQRQNNANAQVLVVTF
jgi:hypothetical protein